jgi:hypothetical protein
MVRVEPLVTLSPNLCHGLRRHEKYFSGAFTEINENVSPIFFIIYSKIIFDKLGDKNIEAQTPFHDHFFVIHFGAPPQLHSIWRELFLRTNLQIILRSFHVLG